MKYDIYFVCSQCKVWHQSIIDWFVSLLIILSTYWSSHRFHLPIQLNHYYRSQSVMFTITQLLYAYKAPLDARVNQNDSNYRISERWSQSCMRFIMLCVQPDNCWQIAVVSPSFHVRPSAGRAAIFMYVAIAGVETRSIERAENPAQWLIEFASRLGAPARRRSVLPGRVIRCHRGKMMGTYHARHTNDCWLLLHQLHQQQQQLKRHWCLRSSSLNCSPVFTINKHCPNTRNPAITI